ncbi:Palmitoyltransferase [Rhodotorula toruloides]|uniref:Palmitoyltransferase n=2 Tax=Rhodotorula toruloides TaxID=5286 RepID=A0A2T0AIW3_RHOTO|nr:Palmitoyltransferase [Rhodotorula toruloides]PRQ77934.1 DHHC palmitoyltransferase-domain containing protein [Rhodotorula toruloides]
MLSCSSVIAGAGRCVNKGFRRFEKTVARRLDAASRRLGPLFVSLAVLLISACAFAFFETVFPEHFLTPDSSWWSFALGTTWCSWLVLMFSFNYFMAITTPAGSPLDPPSPSPPAQPLPLIGPLLLRLATSRSLPRAREADQGRRRIVREIQAAQTKERERERVEPPPAENDERSGRYARSCKKCPATSSGGRPPKPERTHHCSVCQTCILKFDHHCPWIKGCVGLHNERYFVLFLCYFSVACLTAAALGFGTAKRCFQMSFSMNPTWNHRSPRLLVLLMEVLACVMGLAVSFMCLSQLLLVARNQTNVEANDNDWYRKVAISRGRTFRNPYDLGWRQNFRGLFNIGLASEGRYPWVTLFLPVAIPPAGDGWTWRKRKNWREYAMEFEDELTDEEEASEGEEF